MGYLVLTRKVGETLMIGDDVSVVVMGVNHGQVKIGIDAPRDVVILRPELTSDAADHLKMRCCHG